MRQLFFIVLFLNFSIIIYSQNWSPVVSGNKYHYTCDTTNTIFTIQADSFIVDSGKTTYYLNRIVLPCDTCINVSSYESNCGQLDRLYLKNQAQFLMRNCEVTDSTFWFNSPESYVIYPYLPVGNSWLFDTLNNVTANIEFRGTDSVMNQLDSVCLILLSTGDSIILSRNYGVVKFPINNLEYFRLYGVEGNIQVGGHLADYMDFFNFEVGDYFVYDILNSFPECPSSCRKEWHYEITGKTTYADGYQYQISGWYCDWYWACINPTNFTGVLTFYEQSSGPMEFDYTYDYYRKESFYNTHSFGIINDFSSWPFQYFIQKKYPDNGLTIIESNSNSMCSLYPSSLIYNPDIINSYGECINYSNYCGNPNDRVCNFLKVKEGIGILNQYYCGFEFSYIMNLLLYIHQGDTIIDLMVDSPEEIIQESNEPSLFPNPVQNSFTLSHSNEFKSAEIYTSTGKCIGIIKLMNDGETIINTSEYSHGLYIAVLKGESKSTSLKFTVY